MDHARGTVWHSRYFSVSLACACSRRVLFDYKVTEIAFACVRFGAARARLVVPECVPERKRGSVSEAARDARPLLSMGNFNNFALYGIVVPHLTIMVAANRHYGHVTMAQRAVDAQGSAWPPRRTCTPTCTAGISPGRNNAMVRDEMSERNGQNKEIIDRR